MNENEMNLLETELRSWKPRRPSAKLEQKLFAQTPAQPGRSLSPFQWLAPIAACCLLTAMVMHQHDAMDSDAFVNARGHILVSSNQSAMWLSESALDQSRRNHVGRRFEWTNASAFSSSVGSFLPGQVN